MLKARKSITDLVLENIKEEKGNFFHLAPNMIGSVTNADMNISKNIFTVDFVTNQGNKMKLITKPSCFDNWTKISDNDSGMLDFVKSFIQLSTIEDEMESEKLEEIVDEYGDIIPDDDQPNNSSNSMVGNSKFDSEKSIKQTIAKSKRYYGDLGLGVITW
jgi:hypothetical protein